MPEYSTNAIIAELDKTADSAVDGYLREHPECGTREEAFCALMAEVEKSFSTNNIDPVTSDAANILMKRWGW